MQRISDILKHGAERSGSLYDHLIARFRGTENTFMIIVAMIIGLIGGYSAVAIHRLIHFFQDIFWGSNHLTVEILNELSWPIKIIVPVVGSLIVGAIIHFFSSEAKGHGVPEVMEAIALRGGKIRPRVIFSKLFSSSIYIGAGGSVGPEGPVIQIGASIGSAVGQFFKVNPNRMKTFVACGAASGIAAAFNAPVAGALFSLEVILGDFAVAQFSPIVVSSVAATIISRRYLGNFPAFPVPEYHLVSPLEMIPYAILGLLAGGVALGFTHLLYSIEDYFDKLKFSGILKTGIGGLLLGILGIFVPGVFGVGYDSMNAALMGDIAWYMMLLLVFAKILASGISLGSGASGGVFAPTLFMGTMTGGFFGALVHMAFPAITASSGAYSLVGMAAVVAAAMHAPITAILIIFEMTNDYKIILPLMISTIIATIFATKLQKESIYTLKLVRKGINLFAGRDINLLRDKKVQHIIRNNVGIIHSTETLIPIISQMIREGYDEYFVVNKAGRLVGTLNLQDIKDFMSQQELLANLVIAADIMNYDLHAVNPDDNLDLLMHIFGKTDKKELPVINNESERELIGSVRSQDLIDIYNKEIFQRDLSGGVSSMLQGMETGRTIEVIDQYRLMELPVPDEFIHKKIRQLEIRNKYDIEIILIRKTAAFDEPGARSRSVFPRADYIFEDRDEVLVLGEPENIERFQKRNPRQTKFLGNEPAD